MESMYKIPLLSVYCIVYTNNIMFSADAVVWMLEHVDGIFTVAMAVQENYS